MFEAHIVLLRNTLFLLLLFSFPVSLTMAATIIVTERDAGRTVEIENGNQLQIVLEGNPSTGYVWEPESLDSDVLSQGDNQYIPGRRAFGAGGTTILHFVAIAPGETPLRLVYHRPFETGTSGQRRFEVLVKIK